MVKSNLAMFEKENISYVAFEVETKTVPIFGFVIWRLGVQQNCRECGTKLRGKFVPKQVALGPNAK